RPTHRRAELRLTTSLPRASMKLGSVGDGIRTKEAIMSRSYLLRSLATGLLLLVLAAPVGARPFRSFFAGRQPQTPVAAGATNTMAPAATVTPSPAMNSMAMMNPAMAMTPVLQPPASVFILPQRRMHFFGNRYSAMMMGYSSSYGAMPYSYPQAGG